MQGSLGWRKTDYSSNIWNLIYGLPEGDSVLLVELPHQLLHLAPLDISLLDVILYPLKKKEKSEINKNQLHKEQNKYANLPVPAQCGLAFPEA